MSSENTVGKGKLAPLRTMQFKIRLHILCSILGLQCPLHCYKLTVAVFVPLFQVEKKKVFTQHTNSQMIHYQNWKLLKDSIFSNAKIMAHCVQILIYAPLPPPPPNITSLRINKIQFVEQPTESFTRKNYALKGG